MSSYTCDLGGTRHGFPTLAALLTIAWLMLLCSSSIEVWQARQIKNWP